MRLKTLLSTEAGKLVPGARPQIAGTPPRAGEQRKWQNWGGNAFFGELETRLRILIFQGSGLRDRIITDYFALFNLARSD